MKTHRVLLSLALLAATASQAATVELFHETFDGNDQKWSYSSTGARSYDKTWTEGDTVKPGYKGVKLGSTSVTGSITSEAFALGNTTDAVTITIVAAAYPNTSGGKEGIAVTVYDSSDSVVFSDAVEELVQHSSTDKVEIPATADYTHTFTIPAASLPSSGGIHLKIESTNTKSGQYRALIGDVLATQTDSSSGPSPLAAPTGLAESSVTDSGFALSWGAVDHAAGYAVYTNGAVAGSCASPETSLSLAGLAADTAYSVQVQALAADGSTDYEDSALSAALSVTTLLPEGLLRATLLEENFSNATAGWGSSSYFHSKAADAGTWTDLDGCTNMANARSAIVIGRASVDGCALSPAITLTNVMSGTVTIAFDTASYYGKSASGTLSIVDAGSGDVLSVVTNFTPPAIATDSTAAASVASVADGGVRIVATGVSVPGTFRLRFDSYKGTGDNYNRIYLDSILVTQVYDPNFAALAAPTGVAESDVGKHGFTVSWTGVANATGYEVWLDGAVAGSCAATDTSMALTGLADGTTYSVQVKALGDNLHYGDSPLSTAISVTTLEDAQKVVFTVTGAPTEPVVAGDTVAFTVTAEVEETGAAAVVAFAGGLSGATFAAATGAFSWTPTEGDVGSHTATFTSGEYSTNVAITVVSAMETRTLATENFSKISSSSWTSTSGYTNAMDGDIGTWTGDNSLIKTKSAVIVGRANANGTIVSPAIDLPVRTPGSLSVSFDTGSLPDKLASVEARILDASDGSVLYATNLPTVASLPSTATAVADAGVRVTVAPGADVALPAAIQLSLTTYESAGINSHRVYLDTVVFAQTLSARLRDLATPTGLAVVGEPGENGFTVGWAAVSGATNYAVRVTDAAGAVVFSAPFCAAAQATVSGLADDEAYAVLVRATGDEAVWTPSPWSEALAVRTARSSAHPTLSFGGWQNAVGDGGLYAGVANSAAVSAVRDNGTNAVVTLESVSPAPAVGPTLEDGVLAWTPVDADTNRTFTISFLMDGTYATNLSFKVKDLAPLAPPTVTATNVLWNSFDLAWNSQYRAAGYAVRAWTDCPNPNATATRVEEAFANWPKTRPAGWSYHTLSSGYKDAAAPVSFDATGDAMETYDLGGTISSVSFHAAGHSISNSTSALTVVGIAADNTETVLATLTYADIGQTATGIDRTYSVPAGVRRIAWRYSKDKGGIGVGSIVIEGSGFSTPRWLPGWGPAAKDVGLVQGCTVRKPRPGKALGVDPADKKKDLTVPRANYEEVSVRDAAGTSLSAVVAVDVPAPPRSVRASMMIVR